MAHYYIQADKGVEPRHYVPMASRPDEMRPTRITDVRKWWKADEFVVPSVTTIQNVLAKDALVNWKIDQHLHEAWKDQADDSGSTWVSFPDYKTEIKRKTEIEMDKAPSAGTDFHGLMEAYSLGFIELDEKDEEMCSSVFKQIEKHTNMKDATLTPERNFVSPLGYGGQIDLDITDVDSDWIIDYKTKQTADKFKPGKMAYADHYMQLSAYREGIRQPKARCANVFVCLEDGQIDFHEHKEEDLQKGWAIFQHALAIWQINNGWHDYFPQMGSAA